MCDTLVAIAVALAIVAMVVWWGGGSCGGKTGFTSGHACIGHDKNGEWNPCLDSCPSKSGIVRNYVPIIECDSSGRCPGKLVCDPKTRRCERHPRACEDIPHPIP